MERTMAELPVSTTQPVQAARCVGSPSAMRLARKAAAATALVALAPAAGAQVPPSCAPSVPCQLTASLPASRGGFVDTRLAPDGVRAVFVHVGEDASRQLYSVPVAGNGLPVQLNAPGLDQIDDVEISANSRWVVYTASEPGSSTRRLFSVPIGGPASANTRLASDVPQAPQISRDGRKVVFRTSDGRALHAVPIDGSGDAGTRLTDPMVEGGAVTSFAISADSGSVVYMADQETHGQTELYRVPLTLEPQTDPATTKLSHPADGAVHSFSVARTDERVLYRTIRDNVAQLHSAHLLGGPTVRLNVPLPPGWDVALPFEGPTGLRRGYAHAQGGHAVYEIEFRDPFSGDIQRELYSVPISGPASASVRLDVPDPAADEAGFQIRGNGGYVVYTMDAENSDDVSAYGVPTRGPAGASALVVSPSPRGDQFALHATPDGTRVVWPFQGADGRTSMFSTLISGGGAVRLSQDESVVGPPVINRSGLRDAYLAEVPGTGQRDVLSVHPAGAGAPFNLTTALDRPFLSRLAMTASHAVYSAAEPAGASSHLYSSKLVPAP
jgi:hypothetical protein